MTSTLMCTTNLFVAAAPVAGLVSTPNCDSRGTKIIAFHGAKDLLVPISGAVPSMLYPVIPPWARTNRYSTMHRLASMDGCKKAPRVSSPFGLQISEYGCKKMLIVNPQGFHEWPTYATSMIFQNFREQ